MTNQHGYLLLRVSREELQRHFAERIAHHTRRGAEHMERAEQLAAELEEQLASADSVTERLAVKASNSYTNKASDLDRARDSGRTHAKQVQFFQFVLDHLPPGEYADLAHNELSTWELVPGRFM